MGSLLHLIYFADDVAATWQQSCTFLSSVITFRVSQTQKALYAQLIPSQFSACLIHILFHYGHWHIWINRHRMSTMMHVQSWPTSTY